MCKLGCDCRVILNLLVRSSDLNDRLLEPLINRPFGSNVSAPVTGLEMTDSSHDGFLMWAPLSGTSLVSLTSVGLWAGGSDRDRVNCEGIIPNLW